MVRSCVCRGKGGRGRCVVVWEHLPSHATGLAVSHPANTRHTPLEGAKHSMSAKGHYMPSAEVPRTTSGAVQSNHTNGASATPLGPVWVHARYPLRWGLEPLSDGARNCRAVGLAPHDVERLWWRAGGLRRRRGSHCGQVCTTRHHLTSASYIIHTERECSCTWVHTHGRLSTG